MSIAPLTKIMMARVSSLIRIDKVFVRIYFKA